MFKKFIDWWTGNYEQLDEVYGQMTCTSQITGTEYKTRVRMVIEKHNKLGNERAFIEELDGTTHSISVKHAKSLIERERIKNGFSTN